MIPERDMQALKSLSRAVRGGTLDAHRLAERAYEMGSEACHDAISRSFALPDILNLKELEKVALRNAIERTGGDIREAAQLLGIGKTTAYRKARKYGLTTRGIVCPNCHLAIEPRPACAAG